jgi:beta-phosphoglucomutase
MFKGVLFDLDGVLTDTAEFHYRAWKQLANEIGIDFDRTFNEQLKGVSRDDSLKRLLAHGGKAQAYSATEFAALTKKKNEYYLTAVKAISKEDVFPGIVALLTALKQADIKIALASASKNGPMLLEKLGLHAYFDAIANPAEVAHGKPAPDIFNLAAKNVGLPSSSCIGIEDAIAGITAIKASGALPIGVGRAQDLGTDIALVASTADLSLTFLKTVWQERGPVAVSLS